MSAADLSLNYDDLLQTVRDTERGRWFLSEYENRLRRNESASILASIAKLENVIAGMAPGAADAALVARAKSAISAARKEIASLDGKKSGLTDEVHLFAKLADMARASFAEGKTDNSLINVGVCRALQLVDQLDQDFAAVPVTLPKMEVHQVPLAYFASDADVFEPHANVQSANDQAGKSKARFAPKEVERGARLVVRKLGEVTESVPAVAATSQDHAAETVETQPLATPSEPATQLLAIQQEAVAQRVVTPLVAGIEKQSRVVIIRRKPEEMADVPMMDEAKSDSAA